MVGRINHTWDQLELGDGRVDLDTAGNPPQRVRKWACRALIGACNGLFQMPETHVCDRSGVSTSVESLYVEGMQNSLVYFDGDVEEVVAFILDAYTLRAVLPFSPVTPVGHDVFPYRLEWKMLTQARRVFAHEDYFLTRQSRSDHIFGRHSDAPAGCTWTSTLIPAPVMSLRQARRCQVVSRSSNCSSFATMWVSQQRSALINMVRDAPPQRICYYDCKWPCVGNMN